MVEVGDSGSYSLLNNDKIKEIDKVDTSNENITSIFPPPDFRFRIESEDSVSITIRNIGNKDIETSKLLVFVDDKLVDCEWSQGITKTLSPLAKCQFIGNKCTSGQKVKVSSESPAYLDILTCEL